MRKNEIKHYGVPRRSGRYPYGSGENPFQHVGSKLKTSIRNHNQKVGNRYLERGIKELNKNAIKSEKSKVYKWLVKDFVETSAAYDINRGKRALDRAQGRKPGNYTTILGQNGRYKDVVERKNLQEYRNNTKRQYENYLNKEIDKYYKKHGIENDDIAKVNASLDPEFQAIFQKGTKKYYD